MPKQHAPGSQLHYSSLPLKTNRMVVGKARCLPAHKPMPWWPFKWFPHILPAPFIFFSKSWCAMLGQWGAKAVSGNSGGSTSKQRPRYLYLFLPVLVPVSKIYWAGRAELWLLFTGHSGQLQMLGAHPAPPLIFLEAVSFGFLQPWKWPVAPGRIWAGDLPPLLT